MPQIDIDKFPTNFHDIIKLMDEIDGYIFSFNMIKSQLYKHCQDNLGIDKTILKEVIRERKMSPEVLELRRLLKTAYQQSAGKVDLPEIFKKNTEQMRKVIRTEDGDISD